VRGRAGVSWCEHVSKPAGATVLLRHAETPAFYHCRDFHSMANGAVQGSPETYSFATSSPTFDHLARRDQALAQKHLRAVKAGDLFSFYARQSECNCGRDGSDRRSETRSRRLKLQRVFRCCETASANWPSPSSRDNQADKAFAPWELVQQSRLSVSGVPDETMGTDLTLGADNRARAMRNSRTSCVLPTSPFDLTFRVFLPPDGGLLFWSRPLVSITALEGFANIKRIPSRRSREPTRMFQRFQRPLLATPPRPQNATPNARRCWWGGILLDPETLSTVQQHIVAHVYFDAHQKF